MNYMTEPRLKLRYWYYYAEQELFDIQGGFCLNEPVHSVVRSEGEDGSSYFFFVDELDLWQNTFSPRILFIVS